MSTEQQILKTIRKMVPYSKKYLHDDAAIIEKNLIVTTDSFVQNTHFTLKTYTPEEIGYKAIVANLSDIAAMGGKPMYALISLALPKNIKTNWIKRLYKGFMSCTKKYKTQIIGGNLTCGKEINITTTVIGKVMVRAGLAPAQIGKRSNAKTDDLVFVTGIFGKKRKQPIPQIKLGQKIVKVIKRIALMDSSDGLADCLIQIAKESKVKIVALEDKIPKAQSVQRALYQGEDYELVGTASEKDIAKLIKIRGIKVIGTVNKGHGAYLKKKSGALVKLDMQKTYKHFS